jgi:hypothetical protein
MTHTIISLNPAIGLGVVVCFMIFISFTPYLLGRWLFAKHIDNNIKEVGVLLYRSVGVLLVFMLSLNFVDIRSEYVKVEKSVELAAINLGGVISDLDKFGTHESNQLIIKLVEYTNIVIHEEWSLLAQGRYSQKAQKLFREITYGIFSLEPKSPLQKELHKFLIKNIDEMSNYRLKRIFAAIASTSWFIMVVFIIFLVNMFLLCVHPFRAPIPIFVASYSTLIGIVVYCIMALSSPYQGLSKVSLKPLETIYNHIVSTPEFEKILKDTQKGTTD